MPLERGRSAPLHQPGDGPRPACSGGLCSARATSITSPCTAQMLECRRSQGFWGARGADSNNIAKPCVAAVKWGGPPLPSRFSGAWGDADSQALSAPLLEPGMVTTQCPWCGISKKYPLGVDGVELSPCGSRSVVSLVHAWTALGSKPLAASAWAKEAQGSEQHRAKWARPAVGFRAPGGTLLGAVPTPPSLHRVWWVAEWPRRELGGAQAALALPGLAPLHSSLPPRALPHSVLPTAFLPQLLLPPKSPAFTTLSPMSLDGAHRPAATSQATPLPAPCSPPVLRQGGAAPSPLPPRWAPACPRGVHGTGFGR